MTFLIISLTNNVFPVPPVIIFPTLIIKNLYFLFFEKHLFNVITNKYKNDIGKKNKETNLKKTDLFLNKNFL